MTNKTSKKRGRNKGNIRCETKNGPPNPRFSKKLDLSLWGAFKDAMSWLILAAFLFWFAMRVLRPHFFGHTQLGCSNFWDATN